MPEPLQFRELLLLGAVPAKARGLPTGFERSLEREFSFAVSLWIRSLREWRRSTGERISDRSIVVIAKDQVSCDLAGETAILNVKNGVYYGLDPVGARIWNLIQQPRAVAEIQKTIIAEYDVEPERCARDLKDLLEKLLAEGLIEVRDESGA